MAQYWNGEAEALAHRNRTDQVHLRLYWELNPSTLIAVNDSPQKDGECEVGEGEKQEADTVIIVGRNPRSWGTFDEPTVVGNVR